MTERRDFIKKTLVGTAGITIGAMGFSAKSYGAIMGANEKITLAQIGIRGQGNGHIGTWCSLKDNRNVHLKTICDVDEELFPERIKKVEKAIGTKPLTEWDMRRVFDDKEIDAITGMRWQPFGQHRQGNMPIVKNQHATMFLKAVK